MVSIAQKIRLVGTESARIGEYLETLSPEAWLTDSACDAWQVSDVVAHMAGAVERFGTNIVRGAAGDASPPQGFPPAGEGDMAARLRANAQVAIDFRTSLGDGVLPAYNDSRVKFDEFLSGLGEQDRDKPCYHVAGTISIWTYLNLRITELIVHEWDIRSRLEPPAVLSPVSLPAIMEMFPVFVVGRLFHPGTGLPTPTRFRFEVTGTVSGSHDIVAGGGQKAVMEPAGQQSPDVTFKCDTQTFVLMVYGRITLDEAIDGGKITVSGDSGLAAQFGN